MDPEATAQEAIVPEAATQTAIQTVPVILTVIQIVVMVEVHPEEVEQVEAGSFIDQC